MKKIFLYNFISFIVILIVVEIIFNVLPTSDSEKTNPVNKNSPYLHLIKNKDLLISSGVFFEHKVRKHTNNYGYFSDIDYQNTLDKKLITIGSSLVTANQVSNKDSFHGLINSKIVGKNQLYMLAGANAPQSQYLAYTKMAINEFNPYAFIIIIGNTDFTGSIISNALPNSGYHYFESTDESSPLILNDYVPSKSKELLRNFATARYLFLNARIQFIELPKLQKTTKTQNSESVLNYELLNYKLIDSFFSNLKNLVKDIPVLIVLDSTNNINRSQIELNMSRFNQKEYILKKSNSYGFETIDLTDIFINDFKNTGLRSEWLNDGHWNENGHKIVSQAIEGSVIYNKYINK